ncbi:MAG: tail fiber protein [Terracidiphilus sp.]|jgi:microcystin-dependent protein
MSTPYIGQLLLAAFNFAPKNYALCNGQTMAINQNQALFSLIGTTYGGNGIQTFALPNLQGRTSVGVGNSISYGEVAGTESHTLISSEVPLHTHPLMAGPTATQSKPPTGATLGGAGANLYVTAGSLTAMNNASLAPYGGSQPHENRQPFLVMNWCIALYGIFPSRN